MANEAQVGSHGWNVDLTLKDNLGDPVDLSLVTTKKFVFARPNGEAFEVSASFITDGSDGQLRYETILGDIDKVGTWKVQVHAISPSFDLWSSSLQFEVKGNLM